MNILINLKTKIQNDIQLLRKAFDGDISWKPGLHTYVLDLPEGKQRWIHLRAGQDLSAELFIDVNHVIHLHGLPAHSLYLALEGAEWSQIPNILLQIHPRHNRDNVMLWTAEAEAVHSALFEPDENCYLCAIEPHTELLPPFSITPKAPYKVDLALTYTCQNKCDHCYNEPERKSVRSLSLPEWEQVIDNLHLLGVPYIILTGGEPTLHPNIVEITAYAAGKGMVVGMNSHGRRFSNPEFAARMKSAGLDNLQITLASHKADIHNQIVGTAAFSETTAGIRNAVQAGIHTITNTTLVKSNQNFVNEHINFLVDLGLKTFAMNSLINSGKGAEFEEGLSLEEAEKCLTAAKAAAHERGLRFLWYTPTEYCQFSPITADAGIKRCNAAEYSMCIEPNGDVLPCQSYYQPVGNILNDPWEKIWQSALFVEIRDRAAELAGKCEGCPDLDICAGGCYLDRVSAPPKVSWNC